MAPSSLHVPSVQLTLLGLREFGCPGSPSSQSTMSCVQVLELVVLKIDEHASGAANGLMPSAAGGMMVARLLRGWSAVTAPEYRPSPSSVDRFGRMVCVEKMR